MKQVAVVTACDDGFVPLLEGWLGSIRRQNASHDIEIVVLDLGLSSRVVERLRDLDVTVKAIPEFVPMPENSPVEMRSVLLRPHLPRIVTGADVVLWADCDTWFQGEKVIEAYCEAAATTDVAVAAEVDRSYPAGIPIDLTSAGIYPNINLRLYLVELLERWYGVHFDAHLAGHLAKSALLNTGILCAKSDSPMWKLWASALAESVDKRGSQLYQPGPLQFADFMIEMFTFNAGVRTGAWSANVLPATFNWMCHLALPRQGADGILCEPSFPFAELQAIHLTSQTKWEDYALKGSGPESAQRSLRSPYHIALT